MSAEWSHSVNYLQRQQQEVSWVNNVCRDGRQQAACQWSLLPVWRTNRKTPAGRRWWGQSGGGCEQCDWMHYELNQRLLSHSTDWPPITIFVFISTKLLKDDCTRVGPLIRPVKVQFQKLTFEILCHDYVLSFVHNLIFEYHSVKCGDVHMVLLWCEL